MISVLNTREYNYVYSCSIGKQVWNTLELIYEWSTKIKKERTNILTQEVEKQSENEDYLQGWFSNI